MVFQHIYAELCVLQSTLVTILYSFVFALVMFTYDGFLYWCTLILLSVRHQTNALNVLIYCISYDVYCQYWMDKRLSWNASKADNVTSIFVQLKNMWVPDIVLLNKWV